PLQRIALPDRVVSSDVVNGFALEHEVSSVDPFLHCLGLFMEASDRVPFESKAPEALRRMHRGNRREFSVRAMESQQILNVNISDAVSIGEHKRLIGRQPLAKTPQPSAGLSLQPGVYQVNF